MSVRCNPKRPPGRSVCKSDHSRGPPAPSPDRPTRCVRPDTPLLHTEAEAEVKQALADYVRQHGPIDVLLYLAHERLDWNTLQERAGLPPSQLKAKIGRVRRHVRRKLAEYLEG